MSRDAPPPLPGGYKVGDKVFYTGAGYTFANGDKVVHGQQGEVMGPITREPHKGQGVAVCFPGNKRHKDCLLTEVRRLRASPTAPPPAPYGWWAACAGEQRRAATAAGRLQGG